MYMWKKLHLLRFSYIQSFDIFFRDLIFINWQSFVGTISGMNQVQDIVQKEELREGANSWGVTGTTRNNNV